MTRKFLISEARHGMVTEFPLLFKKMDPQLETFVHSHEYVELVLILSGSATHVLNDSSQRRQTGDILVIPRRCEHAYLDCSPDFSLINILFIPEELPIPYFDLSQLTGYKTIFSGLDDTIAEKLLAAHCPEKDFHLLVDLAEEMLKEHTRKSPGYLFMEFGIFMTITAHLARLFSFEEHAGHYCISSIAQVIAYLNRHFHETISIAQLCRIGGLSRAVLQRKFKQATGISPVEYQIRKRIQESMILLLSSGENLEGIAQKVGFSDGSYFGKHFKRIAGISPGRYREKKRLRKA